ncbi:MAG: hypothetical protein ACI4S4_07220 [Candidatus Ornithospirochaeta sp.]
MKKRYLAFLVLAMLLVLFPSCKKKDDPSLPAPVVTVAEEKNEELFQKVEETVRNEAENDAPISALTEEKAGEEKERKLSMVYRGGKILLRATFSPESAVIKTNMDEESILSLSSRFAEEYNANISSISAVVEGSDVILSYPAALSDDYLFSFWDDLKTFLDNMNSEEATEEETTDVAEYTVLGLPFGVEVSADKADVTLPDSVKEGDVDAFFAYLIKKNPELAGKAKYMTDGNTVSLYFTESASESDVPLLWKELEKEIEEYLSSDAEVETVEEKEAATEEKKILSSPLSAAGKTLDRMTVSLSISGKYDPSVSFASTIKAQFAYSITEDIRIGGGFGYDTASFIPLFGTVRYDLFDGFYTYSDLGYRFGLGGKEGSVFIDIGAGYEKKINDDFILCGEVQAEMVFSPEVRVMPSVAFGGRYSF